MLLLINPRFHFVKNDMLSIHLGYVSNVGVTYRQNAQDPVANDTFVIRLELMMSDAAETNSGNTFEIKATLSFGDSKVLSGNLPVFIDDSV